MWVEFRRAPSLLAALLDGHRFAPPVLRCFASWCLYGRISDFLQRLLLLFILRHDERETVFFGVRDRERPAANAEFLGEPRRLIVENDRGFAAARACHFDIEPTNLGAPAAAQRLHHRFFGREPAGIAFVFAALLFLAIFYFLGGEDAPAKARPDARIFEGSLDPLHFGEIHAGADDHTCASRAVGEAPCATPQRHMLSTTGLRLVPNGVSEYSTRGGTWGKIFLATKLES